MRDRNCPPELQQLVTLKFTCWEEYREGRHQLEDQKYDHLQDTVLQVVTGFKENRQIYAELEYYKQHNEILGEHPIFKKLLAKKELEKLTSMQLLKKKRATEKSINDFRKKLKENTLPELQKSRREKLMYREWELEQIVGLIKALDFKE
ncbi:hypothetical protein Oweho_3207 [Owenweeksia hongkongensis DSM 17368]|uniref:Uncharacterized protein n=1 Tax=Owenweeksia hongkongensis (strain DSM 17368 / CIP 108786 / JCM 12287 / NRRL B-23963 / UST20020801) TaxID=926562 RepID=G8R3S1_OWEHD|nr:hypothetical protein [Owenweeksia hongkongensis]AEV34158.1 hypothetical protein Oweho_3207 [Owenweeksia hongkongensis DSM 17368]